MAIVLRQHKLIYDGTNAVELTNSHGWALTFDDGEAMRFEHPNGEVWTVRSGHVVIYQDMRPIGGLCDVVTVVSADQFATIYEEV